MLPSCAVLTLAVVFCASARSEDRESPSPGYAVDSVLRKVMAGPTGNYVITVDGNLEFKETIKVNKKTEGAQERLEDYTFEGCCTLPSNHTFPDTLTQCIAGVRRSFPEEAATDERTKARRRLTTFNCIIQCVSYRLGLSDQKGSIKSEEMLRFMLSDSRTVTLGISEEMISTCIDTARAKGSEMLQSNQELDICDTSNAEVFQFVKCMTELENLHCPAAYFIHSKYCDRSRQMMKKQMRHRAEYKRTNY